MRHTVLAIVLTGCAPDPSVYALFYEGPPEPVAVNAGGGGHGGSEPGAGGDGGGAGGEAGAGGGGGTTGTGGQGGDGGASTSVSSTSTGVVEPQCATAADCNGVNDDCRRTICNEGRCGIETMQRGTPVSEQIDGDCQRVVCNGVGGTEVMYHASDMPLETMPCASPRCSREGPFWEPHVKGAFCGDGWQCDGSGNCLPAQPGSYDAGVKVQVTLYTWSP